MAKRIDAKILRLIQNKAVQQLSPKRRMETNLSVINEIQPARSVIKAGHQKITCKKPTAVIFVDDEPMANWAHDCRYLLHDADSGDLYKEVRAGFPPFLIDPPDSYINFHVPVAVTIPTRKIWALEPRIVFPLRIPKGKRYAILFSGASNNRHVNDMEFLYRQLIDRFFFDENDICVLNYDGTLNYSGSPKPVTVWPGDGSTYRMPVNDAGTKAALANAIDAVKPKLKEDDLLLIHTNNHGGHDGTESYLCTYSGPSYTASDLAAKLGELPAFNDLVVMMEQCHAGGFNDMIIETSKAARTTFAGACTEGKNSIGGPDFDPFARDWIAALAGSDPYGAALASNPDYDASGRISSREAFAYADDIHNAYDSPVYTAYGSDAGDQNLHQKWRYLHLYRELVLVELERLWSELDGPIQYQRALKDRVIPRLTELDDKWAVQPDEPDKVKKLISMAIRSVKR